MIRVWLGAVSIVFLFLASAWYCSYSRAVNADRVALLSPVDFTGIQKLAIGSSRFRYGFVGNSLPYPDMNTVDSESVPVRHPAKDTLPVLRLATVDQVGETQTAELLSLAVSQGVEKLLLEINDFVYERYTPKSVVNAPLREWAFMALDFLSRLRHRTVECLRSLNWKASNPVVAGLVSQEPQLNGKSTIFTSGFIRGVETEFKPSALTKELSITNYRLKMPTDPAELKRNIDFARSRGTQVLLVLPPMSRFEASLVGQPRFVQLVEQVMELARYLGLPAWHPSEPWADEVFLDAFHLNGERARRFQASVMAWSGNLE